jgi:hypothetical protein
MLVRRLEVLRHPFLEVVVAVIAVQSAGLLGMGVDVDGDGRADRVLVSNAKTFF